MTNDNKKTAALTTVQESDKPSIPESQEIVNKYDVDAFLEMRKEFIEKVNTIMVEGKDYHVIQGKKSLAKGGAEKIASIFGWQAAFKKDEDVIGAFKLTDFIPFICTLTKSGQFVGEGRGGATLQKNNSDPNKTIKMAQKSAFIDAVLRASGMSDFFTQDLEDMPKEAVSITSNIPPNGTGSGTKATMKQQGFIMKLRDQKGVQDKITPKMVDNLTLLDAKKWIDKLLKMPDVDGADLGAPFPTIETDGDMAAIYPKEITREDMPN